MLTKAERTKKFILQTAAPIFNEKGISGSSIDDVLEATRLTKGCIYSHFKGKEDLSAQVIKFSLDELSDYIRVLIAREKTAVGKINAFLEYYRNPFSEEMTGGCPLFNIAIEADDNFPEIKKVVAAKFRSALDLFSSILQHGIEQNELSSELNPARFTFKMIAAIEGGLVICRSIDKAQPMFDLFDDFKKELEKFIL